MLSKLTTVMNWTGSSLILVMMCAMSADIIGRTVFGVPLPGVPEVVAMLVAALVFLQSPGTLRADRLIRSDGIVEWLGGRSARAQRALLGTHDVVGFAMFAVLTVALAPILQRHWITNEMYGSPGVFLFPKWPVQAMVVLGSAVMTLQYLACAISNFRAAANPNAHALTTDLANKVVS